jgi:hypothetical protein
LLELRVVAVGYTRLERRAFVEGLVRGCGVAEESDPALFVAESYGKDGSVAPPNLSYSLGGMIIGTLGLKVMPCGTALQRLTGG